MEEYIINGEKAPTAEEVNTLFPEYEVQMLVGVGASGAIYYALLDGNPIAIKILVGKKEMRTMLEFRAEAESMAAMDHPNIIKFHDYGERGIYPYIVLEYIARGTIHEVMSEFKFGLEEILKMGIMICDAITHIHEKGYIHRDLKPDNIMLTTEWSPKIIDFGLAINMENLSHFPTAVGSKGYAAPEVAATPKEIDQKVDVYAMGAILYNLLTGEIPEGDIQNSSQFKEIKPRLRMIISKAVEPDLEKRTASVEMIKVKLISVLNSLELLH